jgi:hypothetical protein
MQEFSRSQIMKVKAISLRGALLCGLLLLAIPLVAHHSFAMFELTKNVTYVGTVLEYRWQNPHTHIIVKVADGAADASTVGIWDIEGGSTNIMARQGWSRITYKAGDAITVVAHPMKDGSKGASLFYAILPDGTKLFHDIARPQKDGGATSTH